MFMAIDMDDADGFLQLVRQGADINAQGPDGMTPAMWSILRGSRRCMGELMNLGFDQNLRDDRGQSIFEYFPKFGTLKLSRLAEAASFVASATMSSVINKNSKSNFKT